MATAVDNKLAAAFRTFAEYRRAELEHERQLTAARSAGGLGGGALIGFDERYKLARAALNELENMAAWLDDGSPSFVPPLTQDELNQWRFAREHGAAIPPHVAEQLADDGR